MDRTQLPHSHGNENEAEHYRHALENTDDFRAVADVFKLLGDPSRVRIFWLLCHMEECVINISALVEMTSPAVSHHLRQLKDSGLVTTRREGKEVYYRAADTEQVELLHKAIEKTMAIACPENECFIHTHEHSERSTGHPADQIDTIREIHDYMAHNLDKRITIEELAREYLMNTTTLKEVFKAVYGESLANHMKEHRMERAAELLRTSRLSVVDIAKAVGYESQSKFTAAFKATYSLTPHEYRRRRS